MDEQRISDLLAESVMAHKAAAAARNKRQPEAADLLRKARDPLEPRSRFPLPEWIMRESVKQFRDSAELFGRAFPPVILDAHGRPFTTPRAGRQGDVINVRLPQRYSAGGI